MMRAFGLKGMAFRSICIPHASAATAVSSASTSTAGPASAAGASPEGWMAKYASLPFYSTDMHTNEEQRVNRTFAYAREVSLDVKEQHLTVDEIGSILRRNHWAIALVNAHQLRCKLCESKLQQKKEKSNQHNSTAPANGSGLPTPSVLPTRSSGQEENSSPFTGHFILLHTYDESNNEFHYMNPGAVGMHSHSCVISSESFEAARTATGTDEDIILFDLQSNHQMVPSLQHPTSVSVDGPVSMDQLKQWGSTVPLATRSSLSTSAPKP